MPSPLLHPDILARAEVLGLQARQVVEGLRVGDHVMSGHGADIKPGNALPMRYIPVGTTLHNVELRPGQGGKIGRSAGIAVQLVAKDGDWATLRMPSTEMRRVAGLLGDLAHGGHGFGFARVDLALGKRPVVIPGTVNNRDLGRGGIIPRPP